jgi:hypothetical protein
VKDYPYDATHQEKTKRAKAGYGPENQASGSASFLLIEPVATGQD